MNFASCKYPRHGCPLETEGIAPFLGFHVLCTYKDLVWHGWISWRRRLELPLFNALNDAAFRVRGRKVEWGRPHGPEFFSICFPTPPTDSR